jgi:hypothetical protein
MALINRNPSSKSTEEYKEPTHYIVNFRCQNCRQAITVQIPFGTSVNKFTSENPETECYKCKVVTKLSSILEPRIKDLY